MSNLNRQDWLDRYSSIVQREAISSARAERLLGAQRPHWQATQELLKKLPSDLPTQAVRVDEEGLVRIGERGELSDSGEAILRDVIEKLIPWRKGPLEVFGETIDAEWRSNLKWDRIAPYLGDLAGKRVADLGCNNGYYMFRLLALNPELVVGFDPSERCYYQFELIQQFIRAQTLAYELLGVEHMPLFPNFFDCVLCLGVLYHRANPIRVLQSIREGMKPGASIIVESQGIEGSDPVAYCPEDRYAKVRNIYFIPTASALRSWVLKAGFVDVEIISSEPLTPDEQRKTKLAPYESLSDFLDPSDPKKTVEGHPAPIRVAVIARKRQ